MMSVLSDYEAKRWMAKAYDVNERVLELWMRDKITEEQAWLLFLWPGSSTDETPGGEGCPHGWHRIFPPLPVSRDIIKFLQTHGHPLYGIPPERGAPLTPGPDPRVAEVLAIVENLEKEAGDDREAAVQERGFLRILPISAHLGPGILPISA